RRRLTVTPRRRLLNRHRADLGLDLRSFEIDQQQAVVERRADDLDALGQHETALELPRRDTAIKIDALGVVDLAATHDQLIVLDANLEIFEREAGDGQRDAQGIFADLLDVI